MLRTGKEHLESLRDGRVIYIGSERVDDVTQHAAFRNAAATVAALYDMKADPANRDTLTYEEEGGRHSIYFLRPRTREDLQRRMLGHRLIADALMVHGIRVEEIINGTRRQVHALTPFARVSGTVITYPPEASPSQSDISSLKP